MDDDNLNGNAQASRRTLGAVFVALLLGWSVAAVYSVHGGMRHNPIRLPWEDDLEVALFLPQGWRFFTRDAEDSWTITYKQLADGSWHPASAGRSADPKFFFGASREGRYQSVETALIEQQISGDWESCVRAPTVCLAEAEVRQTLVSPTPYPALCGPIALVKQKPVPWAWSRTESPFNMPSTYVKVFVKC